MAKKYVELHYSPVENKAKKTASGTYYAIR